MTKVIGLTGSIAVGKSTVSQYLRSHGYMVLDADEIAHQALQKESPCYQAVKESFDCLDDRGTIDRKKLGQIVFVDPIQKQYLEDILHPYILEQFKKGIEECQEELLFLDIPLLYEVHWETLCDKVVVVYVDEEQQRQRLMTRNHISKAQALSLMQQQLSIEDKKSKADFIIDNRRSYEELYQDIERVLKVLKDETIYE